jgi:ABC-type transport system involved in multi-copper enzyme maturation permease subunit
MPIYDQGYQHWKGELRRYPIRWWPILRRGVLEILRQRKYLFLLLGAWFWPLVKGVEFFLKARGGRFLPEDSALSGFLSVGKDFFFGVLTHDLVMLTVLLFVVLTGSEIISRDRHYNALQIYFSKPLTPNDYIFGKLGIVGSFLVMAVWAPMMLLWLFAVSVRTTDGYFGQVWTVPILITLYVAMLIAVAGLLILALSSIGRRGIFIAVSWLILFGWGPMGFPSMVLQGISNQDLWALVRLAGDLEHVGAWMFGLDRGPQFHPALSLLALGAAASVCYVVLRRRIKPVEVVL